MRPAHVLSVVAVLGAGCGGPTPPPFQPVADLKQLMVSVVEPAADEYWDAVGTVVDETGTHDFAPSTAEEWETIRNHAFVVAESGNLMMMSSRAKDGGEWMTLARALIASGQQAIRAAESHDPAAVFDAGAEMYEACTNCHAAYAQELVRPRDR